MLKNLKVATAQFENESGEKSHNINSIENMNGQAAWAGDGLIAFHECSITGYTFARKLSKEQMLDLAEFIPEGDSIIRLSEIAKSHNIVILAGLFEKDQYDNLFNAYVCVDGNGLVARFRNL